ncbi:MAG: TRAP transporter large permease subunit [Desulfohalobiaceae bacterium]|nr:TRAP transporter large permease subunit [Desulfohalobiaceae bacterium]
MMGFEVGFAVFLLGLLLFLLVIGLEIAWAIGIVATVGLIWYVDQPLSQIAETSWGSLNSFTLTAMPLFIFMGSILGNSGVNERLFNAIDKWVGHLPGGLANSVIAGNAVFGAMCGSTMAATATFGKIAYPEMERRQYAPKYGLGSIAAGTVLAPLIPPSIILILYGAWQGESIVDLLAAGVIPGLVLTTLLLAVAMIWDLIDPSVTPEKVNYSWAERFKALFEVTPFVLLIAGVLGAIFLGIMTATEAACLGAFLSLVLTLAYRQLTFEVLQTSLLGTLKVTSFSLFIMAMSTLVSHVFNSAGIIPMIKDTVLALDMGKNSILVLFFLMYLFLGMFFDSWSMLFLTFPFVMPIIIGLGIDPVWWGIVYVLAGEQSTITPPFGLTLFVLRGVIPWQPMGTVVKGALPYFLAIYSTIVLLFLFPQMALWLPSILGG